ncbi:MAG: HEAT repeat domain-containing protein, partial [Planctomycetaceae bacterium]
MKRVVWVTAVCGSLCAAATFGAAGSRIDSLSKELRSGDETARLNAAFSLFDLGPEAKDAVPALADALYAPQPEIRLVAVAALSRMGTDAAPASAALASRLDDSDTGVRTTAIATIEGLGSLATPALAQSLENGSSLSRKNAGALLEMLDDEHVPRVPVLVN